MASTSSTTTNKPFHTYENVGYDDQQQSVVVNNSFIIPSNATSSSSSSLTLSNNGTTNNNNGSGSNSGGFSATALTSISTPTNHSTIVGGSGLLLPTGAATSIAINKTAIESPFVDPLIHGKLIFFSCSSFYCCCCCHCLAHISRHAACLLFSYIIR